MTNLWKTGGVPKKNWKACGVTDRGPNNQMLCEMCGEQHIRYEHLMWHQNYKYLSVGCVCAENMAQGYKGKEAEKLAARQINFLTRQWERLGATNFEKRKFKGLTIYVHEDTHGRFHFLAGKPGVQLNNKASDGFDTAELAKLAAWRRLVEENLV